MISWPGSQQLARTDLTQQVAAQDRVSQRISIIHGVPVDDRNQGILRENYMLHRHYRAARCALRFTAEKWELTHKCKTINAESPDDSMHNRVIAPKFGPLWARMQVKRLAPLGEW